jgi:hypothetical protein
MLKNDSVGDDESGEAHSDDRDLLSIASPLSSKGYFDSPVEDSVEDDDILLRDIQISSNAKTSREHLNSGSDDLLVTDTITNRSSNQPESDDCDVKVSSTNIRLNHKFENYSIIDDVIISPITKELIDRSRQELERRRQKRLSSSSQMSSTLLSDSGSSVLDETTEPQLTNALVTEPIEAQNPFEDPVLVATFFQQQDSFDAPTSDESMIVTQNVTATPKDSDVPITYNVFVVDLNDADKECPEARPSGNLSEGFPDPAQESESSHRQISVVSETDNSTTSLDYEAIFASKRNSSVYTKHESSYQSMVSTLSHQVPVFGDQQDPTCRGRAGWIIFMAVVMLLVILLAALVNKPTATDILTPTTSPSAEPPTELPTSPPSAQPTPKPRTQAPVPVVARPSTTPTLLSTSSLPPFLFPFLTFPPLNSPTGSNQFTSAPAILVAQGVTPSLPTATANAGTPTPIMPSMSSAASPQNFLRWTFPPAALVQPTTRRLRSGGGEQQSKQ